MRKNKIRIGVLAIILLSLLFTACQWNNDQKQTEEPLKIELTIVTPSPEPVALEADIPTEEKDISATAIPQSESKKPEPEPTTKPEEIQPPVTEMICSLTIRCDDVLQNMDKLKSGKEGIIPVDGAILPKQELVFSSGENVFDILYRTVKERGIHIEFVDTPMYNSVYIEGIANLYEFDCGKNSGWVYTVNGESPMHGCSQHKVSQGDNIEFIYKCNLFG